MNVFNTYCVDNYNDWIGYKVVTETGTAIGWVRKLLGDLEEPASISLVVATFPISWLPETIVGAYEVPLDEIIGLRANCLIVFEGAEERIKPLKVGWQNRFQLRKPFQSRSPEAPVAIASASSSGDAYPGKYQPNYDDLEEDLWKDDTDDDFGSSPVRIPRKPNPSPMDNEAEIPLD